MSTFRNPVGPQPTNVYWRRRLVVGLGLLAVLIVILMIVFSPKGTTPTTAESSSPPPIPGAAETPDATTPPVGNNPACDNADLTLTAVTDKASYSAEEVPQLSFVITNEGSKDCVVTGGSDVQEWVIASGDEVYWNSTDCQTGAQPGEVVATADGGEVNGGPIAWNRTRSDKDNCEGTPETVPSGDVTYTLTVTVNGLESEPVRMRLL